MRNMTCTLLAAALAACTAQQAGDLPSRALGAATIDKPVGIPTISQVLTLAVPPVTDDTLICREEVMTGSHIPRRRCLTPRQLRDMRVNIQSWLLSGGHEGGFRLMR